MSTPTTELTGNYSSEVPTQVSQTEVSQTEVPEVAVVIEPEDFKEVKNTVNVALQATKQANEASAIVANLSQIPHPNTAQTLEIINQTQKAVNANVVALTNVHKAHNLVNTVNAAMGATGSTNLKEALETLSKNLAKAAAQVPEGTEGSVVSGGSVHRGDDKTKRALVKLVRHLYLDKKSRDMSRRLRREYNKYNKYDNYYNNDVNNNFNYYSADRRRPSRNRDVNDYYYEEDLVENVFPEAPKEERREYSRLLRREGLRNEENLYGNVVGLNTGLGLRPSSLSQSRQVEKQFRDIQKLTMKASGFRQKAQLLKAQAETLDQQASLIEKQVASLKQIAETAASATVRQAAQSAAAQLSATQQGVVGLANQSRVLAAQASKDAKTAVPGAAVEVGLPQDSLIKAIQNLSKKLGNLDTTLNPNKKNPVMSKNMETSFASQFTS